MPELPDVEGFRHVLAEHAVGREIRDVAVHDASVLRGFDSARLRRTLRGHRFAEPRRCGKWLIAPISGSETCMLAHFGMTGSLLFDSGDTPRHRHDRVVLVYDLGELRYRDMRKLKGLYLADDEDDVGELLDELGPDALGITRAQLADRLGRRSRQLKAALADQSVLAGLGNLLVDEILWRAKLNPKTRTSDLDRSDLGRLHARMGSVLRQSIKAHQVPPRPSWLTGRRDEPSGSCPRCGTSLTHARAGGRSTTWCSHCQGW